MRRIELFVLCVRDFERADVDALADADSMGRTFVEIATRAPRTNGDRGRKLLASKAHREGARVVPNQPHTSRVGKLLRRLCAEDGKPGSKTGQEAYSNHHLYSLCLASKIAHRPGRHAIG